MVFEATGPSNVRSWPTLAKPTLANFSVSVFWTNFLNPKSPNPQNRNPNLEDGAEPSRTHLSGLTHSGFGVVVVMVVVVVVGLDFHRTLLPQDPLPPPPDRPKFRSFFSLSRLKFRSFCVSLGVFSLNFGGVCEDRDPKMCTFGLSGLHTTTREP